MAISPSMPVNQEWTVRRAASPAASPLTGTGLAVLLPSATLPRAPG
ncbi:hypothetical protein AB0M89_33915 [Streptomyces microflavus]